ncbi:hypothetical protein EJ04DRAFT_453510 [Polyplosphaeria fusca]|uniref:Uncharacterized protein n=1 Tax=Polyplosphaeria fusca TaxID=682080 RepID=A0A9P4RDM3_9PLEO|nr:hypothetical protein EJ04DRAFT_453510 [Polyplosphaeria fusca]
MEASIVLRQLLRTPPAQRVLLQSRSFAIAENPTAFALNSNRFISTESLPRIAQPSFWTALIPKPFHSVPPDANAAAPKRRGWNPATPFIVLSLLVGSQAIQLIWVKRDHSRFMRRAEAKIGVLREVIERVQRGEDVDVEKLLGTGDEASEREWAEVLKDIEEEEALFQSRKRRQALRKAAAEEDARQQLEEEVKSAAGTKDQTPVQEAQDGQVKVEAFKGARFY